MKPWLAKPIDRWVIELATRSMAQTACAPLEARGGGPMPVGLELDGGDVTLPDLSLAEDGSFQFSSPIRTASVPNNTVHGKLYRTGESWRKSPTAILLHGWNAEMCYRYRFPFLATRLRRAGFNTVVLELPYHMRRRPRRGPVNDFISGDLSAMLEATKQSVADIRALCRWLRAEGSPAVGLWGFSLGGWLAGLTARVEPNLRFAVLTTPIVDMERAVAELPFCEPVRRSLQGERLGLDTLDLARRAPSLEPRDILLVESRHDLFVPTETIERLWQGWGYPEIWRVAHGHISVLLSLAVTLRTVRWIARKSH